MNTKNTPYTSVRMAKLPIALCYLFATSLWAQTADEIKLLQKSTDRHSLNKFSRQLKKNTLSAKQLQQKAIQKNLTFSGKVNGTYFQLMGFDTLGKPIYYTTYNRDAAIGTGADQLHQLKIYNLEGENITLHEWDGGGVRTSHREFGGRATQKDDPQKEIDHATHVGATLIGAGINVRAKGMAPKAKLNAYDWNNDLEEMTTAALGGALLSNHS